MKTSPPSHAISGTGVPPVRPQIYRTGRPAWFSLLLLISLLPVTVTPAELWVAPGGSNANNGSSNAPLATLTAALAKWQNRPAQLDATAGARPSGRFNSQTEETNETLRIILRNGVYPLASPLQFKTSDSSSTNPPLSIEAAPGEHPILSGGIAVNHWKKATGKIPNLPSASRGNIWVANLPKSNGRPLEFRQLWVNNHKAIRARQPNNDDQARLVAWDKTNQVATISAAALAGVKKPAGLEMVIDQVWEIAVLRVASIRTQGTNALLTFKQPESHIEFQHPWPPVTVNTKYQAPFYLANAIQFLDQPGEWFEDLSAGKIYYWPREGEDMTSAKVFAPAIETLVQIEGTPDNPVSQIQFKGITFAHTTWLRPSHEGHVPLQEDMYLLDAKKLSPKGTPYHRGLDNLAWIGRPPAAVTVKNARHITFENCTFEHVASAGLDFEGGTHDDLVQGCVFHDIGGNGVQIGKFSDTNVETHLPYSPSDQREVCAHEKISNNVIADCGTEDWGSVGIGVGYAQNVSIAHNELFNLPYTAISIGWGWTKMTNASQDNLIFANHVHHVGQQLGDLGGIYLLSAQPGTVVAENSISDMQPSPFVPDPQHWFYLYLDEGSSSITVRDNWCPAEKFLKNANGPGNIWTNNGPQVSETIKNAAGLETAFKNRLIQLP